MPKPKKFSLVTAGKQQHRRRRPIHSYLPGPSDQWDGLRVYSDRLALAD